MVDLLSTYFCMVNTFFQIFSLGLNVILQTGAGALKNNDNLNIRHTFYIPIYSRSWSDSKQAQPWQGYDHLT